MACSDDEVFEFEPPAVKPEFELEALRYHGPKMLFRTFMSRLSVLSVLSVLSRRCRSMIFCSVNKATLAWWEEMKSLSVSYAHESKWVDMTDAEGDVNGHPCNECGHVRT